MTNLESRDIEMKSSHHGQLREIDRTQFHSLVVAACEKPRYTRIISCLHYIYQRVQPIYTIIVNEVSCGKLV
jgi:hypothetical protein